MELNISRFGCPIRVGVPQNQQGTALRAEYSIQTRQSWRIATEVQAKNAQGMSRSSFLSFFLNCFASHLSFPTRWTSQADAYLGPGFQNQLVLRITLPPRLPPEAFLIPETLPWMVPSRLMAHLRLEAPLICMMSLASQ